MDGLSRRMGGFVKKEGGGDPQYRRDKAFVLPRPKRGGELPTSCFASKRKKGKEETDSGGGAETPEEKKTKRRLTP